MPPVHSTPAQSSQPTPQATHSKKIRKYKPEEINLNELAAKSEAILHKQPFQWQLDAAVAILCGQDVVVDVGTGSGKTLVFSLPLLQDKDDVIITVSPLTALMTDQASMAKIPTVAVCSETISQAGTKQLYEDILAGKYRQIILSPEIALSESLRKNLLSKESFYSRLRAVCIDEAHCMSLWGGSFRPDYAGLGKLRGRFPKSVPFVVASATLPEHVLDDIKGQLRLDKFLKVVSLSNARPNVALSIREMKHSEDSKADLRFLIPQGATKPEDIPITLVYGNTRVAVEDAADRLRDWAEDCGIERDCIAFYHARVGEKRKHMLEKQLREGKIRILICTDAVGMGCDMRNILRVILWGLPPSFCALVQRAGRAGRDFTSRGEAILIVSKGVIQKGLTESDIEKQQLATLQPGQVIEAENRSIEAEQILAEADIELPVPSAATQEVTEEGVRVAQDSEPEEEPTERIKKKKRYTKENNTIEVKFLNRFVSTPDCLRQVWDEFFNNKNKLPLTYPTNTTYQHLPGIRCCYRCTPRLFEIETVAKRKVPGLKRGRKKQVTEKEITVVRESLKEWRETTLLNKVYGGLETFSGASILGDDIIERVASCGERITTYEELRRHALWRLGHDTNQNGPNELGTMLVDQLTLIYRKLDDEADQRTQASAANTAWVVVTPADFYNTEDAQSSPTPESTSMAREPTQETSKKRIQTSGRKTSVRGRKRARNTETDEPALSTTRVTTRSESRGRGSRIQTQSRSTARGRGRKKKE